MFVLNKLSNYIAQPHWVAEKYYHCKYDKSTRKLSIKSVINNVFACYYISCDINVLELCEDIGDHGRMITITREKKNKFKITNYKLNGVFQTRVGPHIKSNMHSKKSKDILKRLKNNYVKCKVAIEKRDNLWFRQRFRINPANEFPEIGRFRYFI
jgi:hypothetical protein